MDKEIAREVEDTKSFLFPINELLVSNLQIIQSQNFLNKQYHLENIKLIKYYLEEGGFEKKFKHLFKLLKESFSNQAYQTIICASDANVALINSQFISKKIDYVRIDDCILIIT